MAISSALLVHERDIKNTWQHGNNRRSISELRNSQARRIQHALSYISI